MAENIFLFIPNLIGYLRIVLALLSFYFMSHAHVTAAVLYMISSFLDEFDGHAARHFNQCTKFGALLDMVTDRCGTMCLLMCLCSFYPRYVLLFQLCVAIDISCHWLHLHTSMLQGQTSHKSSEANPNPLLQLYYTSRVVMTVLCTGNELFYISVYLLHFTEGPLLLAGVGLWRIVAWLFLPVALTKSLLALMQGYYSAIALAEIDVEERAKVK